MLCAGLSGIFASGSAQTLFEVSSGTISFISEAPLETIKASTSSIRGLVNITSQTFAFSADVSTFNGFNSDLQREHFHENYMESADFPKATFSGKLIDRFDPALEKQTIRSKGTLNIHGIKKERIIDVVVRREGGQYTFSSDFSVSLKDHGIVIPKIVHQKISEIIRVSVSGKLRPQQP